MITRLEIQNVKETASADIKLDQHNIVLGNWGSGKTTLSDAVQVALTGKPMSDLYSGNGNSVVFDALATGGATTMRVAATASSGIRIERSLSRGKTGTIKQEMSIRGNCRDIDGVRECEAKAAELWGRSIFDVRMLRDDPETVKRVLLAKAGVVYDATAVQGVIVEELAIALLGKEWLHNYQSIIGCDADNARLAAAMQMEKDGVDLAAIRSLVDGATGEDAFATVIALSEAFADRRKDAARTVATEKKALEAYGADMAIADAQSVNIGELRAQIEKAEKELSEATNRIGYAEANARNRADIEQRIANLKATLTGPVDLNAVLEDIDRCEKTIAVELEGVNKARAESDRLKSDVERRTRLVSRIAEIDRILATPEPEPETEGEALSPAQAAAYATLAHLLCNDCVTDLSPKAALASHAERKSGRPVIDRSALEAERLVRRNELAVMPTSEALQNSVAVVACTVETRRNNLEGHKTTLAKLTATRDTLGHIAQFEQQLDVFSTTHNTDELRTLAQGLTASLADKRKALEAAVAQKTRRETYASHQKALMDAGKAVKVWSAAETGATLYGERMVMKALRPVSDQVTVALQKIAPDWVFWFGLDARGRLVFGVEKSVKGGNGVRVKTPYRSLSGAESAIVRNVLGAVLLGMSDSADKLLIDEIAEMPVDLVPTFLAEMRDVCGDSVQTLYMTCHRVSVPEGVNVIER